MIVTGPVTVGVVTWVCGNLGLLFCRRSECRWRPVTISVLRAARLAVSASRASTAGEVAAVTWVWTMDRAASRRMAVKEIWSVLTGRRAVLPAAVFAAVAMSVAAPLLRTSWAPVSHAQNSWRTRSGSSERRAGPVEGPAPVTVVLFSPMVVSEALHRCG